MNHPRSSALIDSLMSVERCGVFCGDGHGMVLGTKQSKDNKDEFVDNRVGVYSNLSKLASQLEVNHRSSRTGNDNNGTTIPNVVAVPPLITIETDTTTILVKECSGYTVGIQLPRSTVPPSDGQVDD